jgi:hypothetical protein
MRAVVLLFVLFHAAPALAQDGRAPASRVPEAVVIAAAPIYVKPGAERPLRTAAVGTVLRVLAEEGEWVQVQFNDPQWGLRTGWVRANLVNIARPETTPIDLSVTTADPLATAPNYPPAARTPPQQPAGVPPQAPRAGLPQLREGFWFNVGLGFGSLGCEDCSTREGGLSGGLSLGGPITDRVLLGVGTAGWAKEVAGETLSVGVLDARVRFYPVRTSGFFLTGGLGVGSVSFAGESEFGAGALVGLGWDIRVSRNVSLTPFWNGFAMSNADGDANVGQIGFGVTIH